MGLIMKKALPAILAIILASGMLITSCTTESGNPGPATATVGQVAPDFTLQNLEGQSVSLSDFRGKPILLNFWATWCGPCRFEMPFLQEIYDERSERGFVLLTVNIAESPAKVTGFMTELDLSLPVLLDARSEISKVYGITAIPTSFLIDKDGVIQKRIIGAFSSTTEIESELSEIVP